MKRESPIVSFCVNHEGRALPAMTRAGGFEVVVRAAGDHRVIEALAESCRVFPVGGPTI